MTHLRSLTNNELLSNLLRCVAEERRKTNDVLDHLREIDRRMIYAELGYSSLFDFCTRHLNYSEGSAQRRITAMRMIRELPEIKDKIAAGNLSLANLSKLNVFIRYQQKSQGEKLTPQNKRALLPLIENKTQKQVELSLASLAPSFIETKETRRAISSEHTEIKIVLNSRQLKIFEDTRMAISNAKPTATQAELLTYVCECYLKSKSRHIKYLSLNSEPKHYSQVN